MMSKPCCASCKHVKPTQTAWQWVKGKPATQSVCQANGWITRLTAWCGEHSPLPPMGTESGGR